MTLSVASTRKRARGLELAVRGSRLPAPSWLVGKGRQLPAVGRGSGGDGSIPRVCRGQRWPCPRSRGLAGCPGLLGSAEHRAGFPQEPLLSLLEKLSAQIFLIDNIAFLSFLFLICFAEALLHVVAVPVPNAS